jgi:hypothetical protein
MLKTLLSKIGISAYTAENGQVAVDMILPDKDLFEIVFMDNQMPVMVNFYILFPPSSLISHSISLEWSNRVARSSRVRVLQSYHRGHGQCI